MGTITSITSKTLEVLLPFKKMLFHNLQKFKKYFVSINVKKNIVSIKIGNR